MDVFSLIVDIKKKKAYSNDMYNNVRSSSKLKHFTTIFS